MSKQQLTIEHLAPYLPYGLKYFIDFEYGDTAVYEMAGLFADSGEVYLYGYETSVDVKNCKPILRPLSDLTKEIEHNGERFYPIGKLHNSSYRRQGSVCKSEYEVNEMIPGIITTKKSSFSQGVEVYLNRVDNNKQWIINYLLKWHFDVFDLHSKGLCIYKDEI